MSAVVIDLSAYRAARERSAPEFVRYDDAGREMRLHALSYRMDDRCWAAYVWAYSMGDAEARVQGMRETLRHDGELHVAGDINLDFSALDSNSVEP